MVAHLLQPAAFGHIGEPRHVARQAGGQLGIGFRRRIAAHIVENPVKAPAVQFRPDIVQAQACHPRPRRRPQHHPDHPSARGAKDRGPFQPQMIQQRQRILRLLRDGVGGRPRPVAFAATTIIHADQADAWQMRHQIVEIGPVAGQPGQAQQRLARALIVIGKTGAIGGGKEVGHHTLLPQKSGPGQAGTAGARGEGGQTRKPPSLSSPVCSTSASKSGTMTWRLPSSPMVPSRFSALIWRLTVSSVRPR